MENLFSPTIKLYHDQHARALACAREILDILESPDDLKIKAEKIRMSLAYLAGVLKPHFASEDHILYPTLIENRDPQTAKTAARFWDEMGGITFAVNSFLDFWRTYGEIEKDPERFASEFNNLSSALRARIEAEEAELYPLFISQGP